MQDLIDSVRENKELSESTKAEVEDMLKNKYAISVAARDRLRRWAEYLRSYTFDTVHIPGADNNFADLLSRNGCAEAVVSTWQEEKDLQQRCEDAIIKPEIMLKLNKAGRKDLDIKGTDLMPVISTDGWPTADRLFKAQQAHGIESDHVKKSASHPLRVNEEGKILLPKEHPVTLEVIAI